MTGNLARAVELQEQSWSLQAEGRLDEAYEACSEALRLVELSETPESADTANLLNELAELQCDRGDLGDAMTLASRARVIVEASRARFTGPDAVRIRLKTASLLGELHRLHEKPDEAAKELDHALALAIATFGDESAEVAEARNNLAVFYKWCGRFDEARALYEQALRVLAQLEGERSLAAGAVHHNIGGILHAQGDCAAAEPHARRACEISQASLGKEHPRTLQDLGAYAAVLDGLERYDESECIYREVLAAWELIGGPEHYEVAANLHNFAATLAARGAWDTAERHYRRALEIKGRLLEDDSVDIAVTRNNLGQLLTQMGRFEEAYALLGRAIRSLEHHLSPEHPHLLAVRRNLQGVTATA
jgi:tetratricopeptide (TPR) repeat protein